MGGVKTLLSIHRGESVESARLIAVCADPWALAFVARVLLRRPLSQDEILGKAEGGRRKALEQILREAEEAAGEGAPRA